MHAPATQSIVQGTVQAEATRLLLCVGLAEADADHLAAHGWRCHHVADVPQALQAASALRLDALLVGDGALAGALAPRLTALREALSGALIVLARQADEIDEILALELGADDYIAAPFHPRRLRARLAAAVRTLLSRTQPSPSPTTDMPALPMVHSGWSLDLSQALLRGNGHELRLTAAQASLLALLLESAGQVVTRGQMARQLGLPLGQSGSALGRAVDMQLHHLRRRLHEAGIAGLQIETVRGLGYSLHARHSPPLRSADGQAQQLAAVA